MLWTCCVRAGLVFNPAFAISRCRAGAPSDNPIFLAQREHILDDLLKAGVTLSSTQLVEQRLSLFQIERIETFSEPAVPEREAREPHPACPGRARAAPCSLRRGVPKIGLLLTIVRIATHVFALEAQGTALRGQWIPTLAPVLPLRTTPNARRAAVN